VVLLLLIVFSYPLFAIVAFVPMITASTLGIQQFSHLLKKEFRPGPLVGYPL
jgi:hypothetical protein